VTVLARNIRPQKIHIIVALVIVIFAVISFVTLSSVKQDVTKIGSKNYELEVADSEPERTRGLSGRTMLADNTGMLFVFDAPAKHCFWMKDTLISLDIVWLDADKKVVDTFASMSPASYPESFCPKRNAQFAIELSAGELQRSGVQNGDLIQL